MDGWWAAAAKKEVVSRHTDKPHAQQHSSSRSNYATVQYSCKKRNNQSVSQPEDKQTTPPDHSRPQQTTGRTTNKHIQFEENE